MKKPILIIFMLLVMAIAIDAQQSEYPKLTGPHLGQKPPGLVPEVFAPGVLSQFSMLHGEIVFSPNGLEVFWTCNAAPVQSHWTVRQTPQGMWSTPEPSFFSIEYIENSMNYSPDGKRLYFHSRRPLQGTGAPKDKDIWYREKTSKGWGDPVPLGPPVNLSTTDENSPSLVRVTQQGGKDMMKKILGIEDSAMEEWRKGNPMKWIDIAADDVIYIDPGLNAPIVGKASYLQYLEPLKGKIFYDKSEYMKPRVALYGKTAVLTYNYHSLRKKPDNQFERTSFWNTTEVYRFIGDEWKIIHTHWSYIQHSLPESLEVTIPVLMKDNKPLGGIAAKIMRLETGALERWRKGDPSGGLEISAPEITYFDPETPARLNGWDELKKEYDKVAGKIHYDVMEFIKPHVLAFDDTAVLFYQFFSTTLNPDGTIQLRIPWNCTEVYAKTAAGWKIVHSHWSFIKGWRKDGGV